MIVLEFTQRANKQFKVLVEDAVMFATRQLMPRIKKPVYINITPVRNLMKKEGIYGDVMNECDGGYREFTIRIDSSLSQDTQELVSTTLHEMVHVWQYMSRRLEQKRARKMKFNKVVYELEMPYDDRPWEIEASIMEEQLLEQWNDNRHREGIL